MQASSEEMVEKKYVTVRLEADVHKELNEIGLRGESFSDIVRRVIKFYKEHQ
jgi:hypothetical protein